MPTQALPLEEVVGDLLGKLLGVQVAADKVQPVELSVEDDHESAVAVYRRDQGDIGALCVCSIELAAALGGALSMVPPAEINRSILTGRIDVMTADNLYEVMNVASRFFMARRNPHIVIDRVHPPGAELPAAVKQCLVAPPSRIDFDVFVERYGGGHMTCIGLEFGD